MRSEWIEFVLEIGYGKGSFNYQVPFIHRTSILCNIFIFIYNYLVNQLNYSKIKN